jgi:CRP/FNR family cyclic AMP-dependent transcriptional regulator
VRVLQADVGECDLCGVLDGVRGGFGLLVLEGMLALDTCVNGRTATDLFGAGDLVQADTCRDDELLDSATSWRALLPTRLALLDAEFAIRVRPWPQVACSLIRRAARHGHDLDQLRAIAGHPRLEVRLDLLFWHLAARWGRVEPGGIRLTLPLTHRLLGQLVAAERPSVSHALHRLMQAHLVTGESGDWHLCGTVEQHLSALAERGPLARGATPGEEHAEPSSERLANA